MKNYLRICADIIEQQRKDKEAYTRMCISCRLYELEKKHTISIHGVLSGEYKI